MSHSLQYQKQPLHFHLPSTIITTSKVRHPSQPIRISFLLSFFIPPHIEPYIPCTYTRTSIPLRFHVTVYPPSTLRSAPVTYVDASESRKVTGPMRSSGEPMRPCGIRDVHCRL